MFSARPLWFYSQTIKIWGMDFGDCHRSLLGHTDSVMCVRFVPKTHYFFSCSKDGSLKYWDADRFEQILHLPAHQSEAWALAISPDSSMVISGGHDRSIRVWERTEDLVFIEEEKERELEAQYEKEMEKEQLQEQNDDGTAKVRVANAAFREAIIWLINVRSLPQDESALATRRTMESLIAGERLMEALDLADNEQREIDEHNAVVERLKRQGESRFPSHRPNPLLYNLTPTRFGTTLHKFLDLPHSRSCPLTPVDVVLQSCTCCERSKAPSSSKRY
jgi:U3 small nucleolar RNA-associated protein 12